MVAGDFNGAAWRKKNGDDQQRDSTIESSNIDGERGHGAFEINRDVLGIRLTDQSCHHEAWIHLSHANAWLLDRYRFRNAVRTEYDRRRGKTRGNPYDHT